MSFSNLPVEVYYNIFEHLEYIDLLLSVSMISMRLNAIVSSYYKFSNVKELSNYKHYYDSFYLLCKNDEKLSMLFNSLKYNRTIETLYIYTTESTTSRMLRDFSNTLKHNLSIENLNLYFSNDIQILDVLPGLLDNLSVKNLAIYFNKKRLGMPHAEEFIDSISKIVEYNKNLTLLDISYTHIGNESIKKIISSFKCNTSIRFLNIKATSCVIDRYFLDALSETNLEHIAIDYNEIPDQSYISEWTSTNKINLKYN